MKNSNIKRIIALACVLLLLIVLFCSCAEPKPVKKKQTFEEYLLELETPKIVTSVDTLGLAFSIVKYRYKTYIVTERYTKEIENY